MSEADKQKQKHFDVAKAAHDLRKKLTMTKAAAIERADGTARLRQGKALSSRQPTCPGTPKVAPSSKQAGEKDTVSQLGLIGSSGGSSSTPVRFTCNGLTALPPVQRCYNATQD